MTLYDYIVVITGILAGLYVIVLEAFRRQITQYLFLLLYLALSLTETIAGYAILRIYGFASAQYMYFYYYCESVLAIILYFVILGFIRQILEDLGAGIYARIAGILLLGGTALVSFLMVEGHKSYMTSRFVVELGRNLNFVGVVLVFLLWSAMRKLHETRARMSQLVLALGIYFCGFALAYGLRMTFPQWRLLRLLPPLLSVWLNCSWAYTFTKLPEEARLATARVAAFATR
jgi:hypothetical protein